MTKLGSLNKNSEIYSEGDLVNATSSSDGLMSSSDKAKLDGIESGAQVNTINSIKVNNSEVTPDQNKSINLSIPTELSLSNKLNPKYIDTDSDHKFVTENNITTWNSKQDAISDLSSIRSGALKGETAVQPNELPDVAKTGSYNDLINKPDLTNNLTKVTNSIKSLTDDNDLTDISNVINALLSYIKGNGYTDPL